MISLMEPAESDASDSTENVYVEKFFNLEHSLTVSVHHSSIFHILSWILYLNTKAYF